MYFFDRKTIYFVWKNKDFWKKEIGNVRFLAIEESCRIELIITDCGRLHGTYTISVLSGELASAIGEICVQNGKGNTSIRCETQAIGSGKIPYQMLTGIRVDLKEDGVLEQHWLPLEKGEVEVWVDEKEVKTHIQYETCNLYSDKWQQLCNIYPVVYPFGDGRAYLSIEPRDFVVLQGKYQSLVENSFLLHSFYQNKYVLLGRSRKGRQNLYYIGVAGIYCEQEKNSARLHGFESYEAKGEQVKNGSFCYYMKRVEI